MPFTQASLKELMPAVSELIIHLLMVPESSITMPAFSALVAKLLVTCGFSAVLRGTAGDIFKVCG